MATEFISNSWLMPEQNNESKLSNYSLDFDGSSQYIDLGTGLDIFRYNINESYSVSLWYKSTSSSLDRTIINFGSNPYRFYLATGNGKLAFGAGNSSTIFGNYNWLPTAGAINDGQWHHICIVQDSSGGVPNLTAYVDGSSSGSGSNTNFATQNNNRIGNGLYGGVEGKLTEVSIFDYALSAPQITELYGTGSAIGNPMAITNGRKPVAYYPLGNSAFNSEFLVPNSAEKDFVFDFVPQDYINCGNNITSLYNGAFSVSYWVNQDTLSSNQHHIFIPYNQSAWANPYVRLMTRVNSSGRLEFRVDEWNNVLYTANGAISSGEWQHVCCTFDGTTNANSMKIYINSGTPVTRTSTSSSITASTNDLFLGTRFSGGANEGIDGKLSNVSIFSYELPATGTESVESLYNYGTPPNIASYSNLQGWWELDASATFDGSNWSIPDASSNSNTGTSSGMTAANLILSDLIINQSYDPFSLSFDGTDDNIEATKLALTTAISVSAWVKTTTTSGTRIIVNEDDWGSNRNWHLYIAGSNKVLFRVYGASGQIAFIIRATSGEITDGNWHHVCATWDGTTNTNGIQLSIDNDIETATATGTGINTDNVNLAIGSASNSSSTNSLSGTVSNVSIYNTGLTSAQVKTLYNEHKPFNLNNFEVTPVSWWRLGSVNSSFDGTNWTVLDEISTSGNNGVSANMTQADLVSGVGATGSGTSSGMSSGTNRTGDAPYSSNNAVSYNMSVTAKSTSTPT